MGFDNWFFFLYTTITMAEIFDPKLIINKTGKFAQKKGFVLIAIFTAILMAISGYLIYAFYLTPSYELHQLLPQNYDISFEFKADRFTFPSVQKNQLLKNPTFNIIYDGIKQEIDNQLDVLPLDAKTALLGFKHFIFFLSENNHFGYIAKIKDNQTKKQLAKLNFSGWPTKIIKDQIFLAANNEDLLNEMASQKLSLGPLSYFSISISPWLKTSFQNNFFKQNYNSQTLTSLQQILLPLALTDNNYSLEFNSNFKLLETILSPEKSTDLSNSIDLNDLMAYLPSNSNTVFGLADLNTLTENLDKNPNLQALFSQFDSYFWLNYQISLSNLLKKLKGPILIGIDGQNWRIITNSKNIELAEYYLHQYFGQFSPKTQLITLPDGTMATELINNPDSVIFKEIEDDGWKFHINNDYDGQIGYAEMNDLLIIGNNINNIEYFGFQPNCQTEDITAIFSINPEKSSLKVSAFLKNFTEVTAVQLNSGHLKVCFEIK